MTTTETVERVVQERQALNEALEELLMNCARGDGIAELSATELSLFDSAGFDNQYGINTLISRCQAALRHKVVTGTESERQQVAASLEAYEQQLCEEGPKILQQIEDLKNQHRRLSEPIEVLTRHVTEMQQARENMRKCVPPWVSQSLSLEKGRIKRHFRDIPEMESRLSVCEGAPTLEEGSEQQGQYLRSALDTNHPAYPEQRVTGAYIRWEVNQAAWKDHCQELRREAEEIRSRLKQRQAEKDAATEEAEHGLDMYADIELPGVMTQLPTQYLTKPAKKKATKPQEKPAKT